jgi:hypothetical protein
MAPQHPTHSPRPGSDRRPKGERRSFLNRTNWTTGLAGAAGLARALGGRVLTAATGEVGRRLARAAGLTVVLAVVVMALYDRGEVPSAAAQPAVRSPAAGATAGQQPRVGSAPRKDPRAVGGLRGRDRPARVGERPAAVAAAWYAARHDVPRAKVKPLQQDRLSAREVRVLVMADHGRGRLRTTLVRVRLSPAGWSVR